MLNSQTAGSPSLDEPTGSAPNNPVKPALNPNDINYVDSDRRLLRRLGRQLAEGYGLRVAR